MNKHNKKFVIVSMPNVGVSILTLILRSLEIFHVDNENDKELAKLTNLLDVSNFLNERLSVNKYTGFKLPHTNLTRIPLVKDYIKNNDIYVIHLYRENIVKQVILGDIKSSPEIDVTKIPSKINKINKGNKELTKCFKGKRYLKISYEELFNGKNRVITHIGKIYNLLKINKNPIVDIPLKKYELSSIKGSVSNYGEILRALRKCKMVKGEWLKGL